MKALKVLFSLALLLNLSTASAQSSNRYPRSTIHIESGEGNNKKSCIGYFYFFTLTKDNAYYGSILVDRTVVNNSPDLKLLFEKEDSGMTSANKEPNILFLSVKSANIIGDNDPATELVAIPFGQIHQLMLEKDIYFDPV